MEIQKEVEMIYAISWSIHLDLVSVYGAAHLEYKVTRACLIILSGLHLSF